MERVESPQAAVDEDDTSTSKTSGLETDELSETERPLRRPIVPPKPPHLALIKTMSMAADHEAGGQQMEQMSPRRQSVPSKGQNGIGAKNRNMRSRVDSKSAAAIQWQADDPETEDLFGYTHKKIQMKYGEVKGELHLVEFPQSDNGIGLSLAGNRDRNKMSVFVVGMQPSSPASAEGLIEIGDELLEINGLVLYGRSHLNASAIIRSIRDPRIKLVLLRRGTEALEEMAVRPLKNQILSHQMKVSVAPASQSRRVIVKKGSSGFGITLTEGTTTDNLRGIFITNISPDSTTAQEKCLKIGDQVLAVNGQPVMDWSSAKVAEAMQAANSGEIELTVATHTIVPLPAGPPRTHGEGDSPRFPSSPMEESQPPPEGRPTSHSLSVDASSAPRKSSAPAGSSGGNSPNLCTIPIVSGQETLIEIEKGGKGLGLSIVGGSDTVLGSVVIHEVYPDGAAAKDGRLKPGDQVLEVNSESLREVPHDSAISILRQTPSKVHMLVYRDPNLQLSLLDPTQIYNIFEVELVKKPGRGLGLSIVGRKNEPGVYVSEVVKAGVAEADGRLMQGDQILAVNGQDLTAAMQEQAAAILKTCMGKVVLKIGRWKLTDGTKGPTATRISTPGTPLSPPAPPAEVLAQSPSTEVHHAKPVSASTQSLTEHEQQPPMVQEKTESQLPEPLPETSASIPNEPLATLKEENTVEMAAPEPSAPPLPPEPEPTASVAEKPEEPGPTTSETSGTTGGGGDAESRTDDEMTDVKLLPELTEQGCDILLAELRKVANQQLGMGIGKRHRGILVTSLQAKSIAAEKLKIGDRLLAVNGQPVADQQSAVTFVKNSGERLTLQIARPKEELQMASQSPIKHDVTLVRGPEGLGISVVGGVGSPHGDLPIYIKSIFARGAAAEDGRLKRGDQILAVNGQSLVSMPHADAVQLLKDARGEIVLTVLSAPDNEE